MIKRESQVLKLGLIGMSPGNGHPYSWAALCNGYDPKLMLECPFPVIPQYLQKAHFPDDFLGSQARVSHIYTQETDLSRHIAGASKIDCVVIRPEEMIGQIDALLLARDDAENHLYFARPFLEAGLPIYIDKPLAYTRREAEELLALQQYEGQIFSCSATRFAPCLQLSSQEKEELGELENALAVCKGSWKQYAVHLIEPLLCLTGFPLINRTTVSFSEGLKELNCLTESGLSLRFQILEQSPESIYMKLQGQKGSQTLYFKDSFTAFRNTLETFFEQARSRHNLIDREETLAIVDLIEKGVRYK